jgi:hypothetical protein
LNRHPEVGEDEFLDIVRVAFDSLPETRRRLLEAVVNGRDPMQVKMPDTVRRRELEELEGLGLLDSDENGRWRLTAQLDGLLRDAGLRTQEGTDAAGVGNEAATVAPSTSDNCSPPASCM